MPSPSQFNSPLCYQLMTHLKKKIVLWMFYFVSFFFLHIFKYASKQNENNAKHGGFSVATTYSGWKQMINENSLYTFSGDYLLFGNGKLFSAHVWTPKIRLRQSTTSLYEQDCFSFLLIPFSPTRLFSFFAIRNSNFVRFSLCWGALTTCAMDKNSPHWTVYSRTKLFSIRFLIIWSFINPIIQYNICM